MAIQGRIRLWMARLLYKAVVFVRDGRFHQIGIDMHRLICYNTSVSRHVDKRWRKGVDSGGLRMKQMVSTVPADIRGITRGRIGKYSPIAHESAYGRIRIS